MSFAESVDRQAVREQIAQGEESGADAYEIREMSCEALYDMVFGESVQPRSEYEDVSLLSDAGVDVVFVRMHLNSAGIQS